MTCARNVEPDAAERYVLGQMTEPEQTAFEEHYFACDECFETVRALQDLQVMLRTSTPAHVKRDEAIGAAVPSTDRTEQAPPNASAMTAAETAQRNAPVSIASRREAAAQAKPAAKQASIRPALWGLAVAASLLMAFLLWQRRPASPEPPIAIAKNEPAPGNTTPSGTAGTGTPSAQGQTPASGSTGSTPSTTTPPPSTTTTPENPPTRRPLDLTALAVVLPPPYVALNTRGADNAAQTQTFQTAMAAYNTKDYRTAATGLRALADANPSDARTQFFLGVSSLMTGDDAAATAALDQAVASGTAPFASEAHFYLAKAALRQKDLARAERELTLAVEHEAGPAGEAPRILRQLRQSRQN